MLKVSETIHHEHTFPDKFRVRTQKIKNETAN